MYAKMKNSYARNESMNIKEYHKKELNFFVHTWQNACISKICPCFCGVTVFCYWYTRNYLFSPLIDSMTLHSRMNPGQPRGHYLIPIDKFINKFS